jgi:hypothetical protein
MSYEFKSQMAFIAADGSYSAQENVMVFDTDALTEKQWQLIDVLPEGMKLEYAMAILDGDDDYVVEIEQDYAE